MVDRVYPNGFLFADGADESIGYDSIVFGGNEREAIQLNLLNFHEQFFVAVGFPQFTERKLQPDYN